MGGAGKNLLSSYLSHTQSDEITWNKLSRFYAPLLSKSGFSLINIRSRQTRSAAGYIRIIYELQNVEYIKANIVSMIIICTVFSSGLGRTFPRFHKEDNHSLMCAQHSESDGRRWVAGTLPVFRSIFFFYLSPLASLLVAHLKL